MRQWHKVCKPRRRVYRYHISGNTAFKPLHKIIKSVSTYQPLYRSVKATLFVCQQIRVLVKLNDKITKGKTRFLVDFIDFILLIFFCFIWVSTNRVYLRPDTIVRSSVPDLACQRPKSLDVVRLRDNVAHALDVLVKALHGVVDSVEADTLLSVTKPGDPRPERVRQAVDGRRQRSHLRVDAQHAAELREYAVALSRLEVREIAAPVVDRLIAVSHADVVHLLEQLVIYRAEFVDGAADFLLVEVGVFFPQILHYRSPV